MSNDYYLVDTKNNVALATEKMDFHPAVKYLNAVGWGAESLGALELGLAIWEEVYLPRLAYLEAHEPPMWPFSIEMLAHWAIVMPVVWAFAGGAEGHIEARDSGQLWPEDKDDPKVIGILPDLTRLEGGDYGCFLSDGTFAPFAEDYWRGGGEDRFEGWERFWHMRGWGDPGPHTRNRGYDAAKKQLDAWRETGMRWKREAL